jgi:acetyl esterase
MPLAPETKAIIDLMDANWPDLSSTPAPEVRQLVREATEAARVDGPPPPEVARVEDRTIPGPDGAIPVRIYWPAQPTATTASAGALPIVVYFHGGGWVICDLDSHDATCRTLANGSGAVVVSVDYRLAPEHRFPAAPEDAYAATVWAAAHAAELGADATRLAVAGDSAGGNLAAVVPLMAKDRGGPPLRFQLLIYPVTDVSPTRDDYPSKSDNATGYFLTTEHMEWYRDKYLPDGADGSTPYLSPIHATDLAGLPPALVITAEYDPLRDEGEAYARALKEAGVAAEIERCTGMFHGFFGMSTILDGAKVANERAAAALLHALALA